MVIEGVHLLPDLPSPHLLERATTVRALLAVRDRGRTGSISTRAALQTLRPPERYLEAFDRIRALQDYLIVRAEAAGIPVIDARRPGVTLRRVLEVVLDAVGAGRAAPGAKLSRDRRRASEGTWHMRFFIDTGSVAEVEEIAAWGILSGATTNPSLLAKEEGDPGDIVRRICDIVGGPVSAEVVSDDAAGMVEEGRALDALHEHVVVKVPFSSEGLAATRALSDEEHPRQHDARVLGQPGAAVGAGGRDLSRPASWAGWTTSRSTRPRWSRRSWRRCGRGARRPRCWRPRSAIPSTS